LRLYFCVWSRPIQRKAGKRSREFTGTVLTLF
jgi:hypothetical protein